MPELVTLDDDDSEKAPAVESAQPAQDSVAEVVETAQQEGETAPGPVEGEASETVEETAPGTAEVEASESVEEDNSHEFFDDQYMDELAKKKQEKEQLEADLARCQTALEIVEFERCETALAIEEGPHEDSAPVEQVVAETAAPIEEVPTPQAEIVAPSSPKGQKRPIANPPEITPQLMMTCFTAFMGQLVQQSLSNAVQAPVPKKSRGKKSFLRR